MTPLMDQAAVGDLGTRALPETFTFGEGSTSLLVTIDTQGKIARIEGLGSIQKDNSIIPLLSKAIKELTSHFPGVSIVVISTIESNRARLEKILFGPTITESLNIETVSGGGDDSAATLFLRKSNEVAVAA